MKDQYTGDINDYRKYGLLRVLQEVTGLRLGINWLKTPDDVRTDGEFRTYLNQPQKFKKYDPLLFDQLQSSIKTKRDRKIENIIKTGILGDALSFVSIVPDGVNGRQEHLQSGMEYLHNADIIFFDPDNGVEVKSVPYGRKNSSKYIYLNELAEYYQRGHSLLIYQHFPRAKREIFIKDMVSEFRARLNCQTVLSKSSAHVVFFLIGHKKHALPYVKIKETLEKRWNDQFNTKIHQ